MRGSDVRSGSLFTLVDLEARVRPDHPLRAIRQFTDAALESLTGEFSQLYSGIGRPSIPPEMLLRAMLLQAFYSIRSERQLMERLEFDLLFRWFVGLGIDDPALGSFDLFEEPGPAAGRQDRRPVFGCGAGAAAGQAAALDRSLQRRWRVDRGLGFDEEL